MTAATTERLLEDAGLAVAGQVRWGERPTTTQVGIYVVSMAVCRSSAPIDLNAVSAWLVRRPELTVAGLRPNNASRFARHLARWWLPNETVLYIGKATTLSARVGQYYATPLGARRPHSGGAWLHTLADLEDLTVTWALTNTPTDHESELLNVFRTQTRPPSTYPDLDLVLPWANLELLEAGKRRTRRQRIRGARGPIAQVGD